MCPESIEVDVEDRPEFFAAAFRHLLNGDKKLPPEMRGTSAADVKKLRAVFAESALGILIV